MNQNATLSQIKSVTSPRGASPVSVMRSSLTDSTNSEACAAAAAAAAAVGGSMVVYGSTPPPPMTNGPPPIQRVQGFGVGAQYMISSMCDERRALIGVTFFVRKTIWNQAAQ
eukprot:15329302-Ditylum_brightwellii.AAC.1